ncbi:MAG TPA: acetyl-CoA carboxylase biotin carboxylase subunit [Chloroflexota bacterium]|nr:acetyl-CoA carboxylase biotin carboxylase subunit [Chloroflexota bacterium]
MRPGLSWPFQKVLIANRGEIALRVIQACRELGLCTVAVYSEADRDSLPVTLADEAYEIGPAPSAQSYLNSERILAVARQSGAGAIHPGYGFLAENAGFAGVCRDAGIVFVGPSPESMEAVGGKIAARSLAERLGIPVVPGQTAALESLEAAAAVAERVGYPVAIKASAGGGGRGLKVVHGPAELSAALESAQREGAAYFGDATVFMERYLRAPRHIEVQIAGDQHGTVLAVGTRDCSVQRNHQKLIEEAPAPLDPGLSARIMDAARRLAAAIAYTGAGTAEFLVEGDQFFFLEMNTRIQVEHTVTEAVTGLDLVKMQLLVAAGAPLPFGERDCAPRGHAIECRINAEDPAARFRPGPGLITRYRPPTGPGIRVDSAAFQGYAIPPHYDSMIGKLVAWGRDREEAIARMDRALAQFQIGGVPSTIAFHRLALADPDFVAGGVATTFVGGLDLAGLSPYVPEASTPSPDPGGPAALDGGESYLVEVNGKQFSVKVAADGVRVRGSKRGARRHTTGEADGAVVSPMHGVVLRVAVEAGQRVESGDLLLTIEAMKMENEVLAPRPGTVVKLGAAPGTTVDVGTLLAVVE